MHVKTRKDCKTTDVIETQIWNKLRLMSFQHTTYPRILAGVCLLRILSWGEQKQEGLRYFLIFDFEPLVIVVVEYIICYRCVLQVCTGGIFINTQAPQINSYIRVLLCKTET